MNDTESIIQSETFRLGVTVRLDADDEGLTTADLEVFDENNAIVIQKTSPFALDTEASRPNTYVADLSTSDTDIANATYSYLVRVNWSDGTNDVVPDKDCIDSGACEYPSLIICKKPIA